MICGVCHLTVPIVAVQCLHRVNQRILSNGTSLTLLIPSIYQQAPCFSSRNHRQKNTIRPPWPLPAHLFIIIRRAHNETDHITLQQSISFTIAFAFGDFKSLLQNFGLNRTGSKFGNVLIWQFQKLKKSISQLSNFVYHFLRNQRPYF